MAEEIRVIVEKDGKLLLKVSGREGPQCLALTDALEKEMGEVLDRQRTTEFYKKAQITLANKARNPLKSA
jgi:hypothetical protein